MIYTAPVLPNELYHHGIKGQRWGVRRYQNPDGTYTEEGKRRRRSEDGDISSEKKGFDKKKAFKIGAAVVGTALAAYGAYKVGEYVKLNKDANDLINRVDIIPRMSRIEESARNFAESEAKRRPEFESSPERRAVNYNIAKTAQENVLKKDMAKGGKYDQLRKKMVKDQIKFRKDNFGKKVKDKILPEGYYKRDENGRRTKEWIKTPRAKGYEDSPFGRYEYWTKKVRGK